MELNRKELKTQARQAIRASVPAFWKVSLVYLLLTTALNTLVDLVVPPFQPQSLYLGGGLSWLSLFITILLTLYLWVMRFGYTLWSLRTARAQQPGLGALMEGFGMAGRVVLMELVILLYSFLWALLLSVGFALVLLFLSSVLMGYQAAVIVGMLIAVGIYAAIFAIMLRYAMAPYLLADYPDDGVSAAVRRSVEMMRGRKWDLFKLYFSFLGWELLGILISILVCLPVLAGILATVTSGIPPVEIYNAIVTNSLVTTLTALATIPLYLWLMPYRSTAVALFYRTVMEQPVNPSPMEGGDLPC